MHKKLNCNLLNRRKPEKKWLCIMLLITLCIPHLLAEACGDVNSDNTVNIVDALMTAQFYVGLNPNPFDTAMADVDGNNTINIVDALQIAQFYVGLISQFPGCTPVTPAPTPSNINPVTDEPIGFGRNATGGKGGREIVARSISDIQAAILLDEPLIITIQGSLVHNVSGGDDDARISVKTSNKTFQGADINASVDANFNVVEANNIIFRNLYLSNPEGKGTGDAIEFTKFCNDIWVDHVTFGQCKDGALDFKRACDKITVSWCKFAYTSATHNHNHANLIGHTDTWIDDRGKLNVTMHHNWYATNVIERMPRVRYGKVHVFNNYYSSNRTNYVIGVGVEAQILLEASYFENQGNQTWYNWYDPNKCEDINCADGKIQWTDDNVFDNTTMSTWAPNSDVFDPPYSYLHVKQTAVEARASVTAHAGAFR